MAKAKKEETQAVETTKAAETKADKASYSYDALVAAFEKRFDYMSARTVFNEVLEKLNMKDKQTFTKEEVGKIAETVATVDDTVGVVVEALNEMIK